MKKNDSTCRWHFAYRLWGFRSGAAASENSFERVINLKTAKQIDVTTPQSLLYRADKVFK